MNRNIYSNSGFTLVEVLIAIAILGVFIIPISGMFTTSLKVSESSRISIEAYSIANKVIEGMSDDEICIPSDNSPISANEYAKYNIKSEYDVKRSIQISQNATMGSFIDLKTLNTNGTLLTIDASVDGKLDFTNGLLGQLTYSPAFSPNVAGLTISFDNSTVKNGNTIIANKKFDYVLIIGGNSNLKLTLENTSNVNKTLYLSNIKQGGTFSINTVVTSSGQWISYDNLSTTEANSAGSVATANITMSVRHIPTDKEYSTTTERVFYKYQN